MPFVKDVRLDYEYEFVWERMFDRALQNIYAQCLNLQKKRKSKKHEIGAFLVCFKKTGSWISAILIRSIKM